jgi:hypothetical protein
LTAFWTVDVDVDELPVEPSAPEPVVVDVPALVLPVVLVVVVPLVVVPEAVVPAVPAAGVLEPLLGGVVVVLDVAPAAVLAPAVELLVAAVLPVDPEPPQPARTAAVAIPINSDDGRTNTLLCIGNYPTEIVRGGNHGALPVGGVGAPGCSPLTMERKRHSPAAAGFAST